MKLFVVGRFIKEIEGGSAWDLHGVFEKEEDAVKICIDSSYFVGPIELNKPLPTEQTEWPDCYYPIKME